MPDPSEEFSVVFDEHFRAEPATLLLVAGKRQDHIATGRLDTVCGAKQCQNKHRHPALHIESSATPHLTLDKVSRKRRVIPIFRVSGHNIDMTVQQ